MGAPEPKRISIDEARRLVSERVTCLEGEEVALDDALGRVFAQDAVAPRRSAATPRCTTTAGT